MTKEDIKHLRRKTEALLCSAATEYKFFSVKPSLMSVASLALSCQMCPVPLPTQDILLNLMLILTRTPVSHMSLVTASMQELLANSIDKNYGIAEEVVTMDIDYL